MFQRKDQINHVNNEINNMSCHYSRKKSYIQMREDFKRIIIINEDDETFWINMVKSIKHDEICI